MSSYFTETFQGSEGLGFDNSGWTATGSPDPNGLTSEVNDPPHWGTSSFRLPVSASTNSYVERTVASKTLVYARIEVVLESYTITTSNENFRELFRATNGGSSEAFSVYLEILTPATPRLMVRVTNAAGGTVFQQMVSDPNVGQRYRVDVKYDMAGNTYELWLNGVSQRTGTLTSPVASIDTISIGTKSLNSAEETGQAWVYLNQVALDDANYIGNETIDWKGQSFGVNEVIMTYGDAANFTVDYDDGELPTWESSTGSVLTTKNESPTIEIRADFVSYEDRTLVIGATADATRFRQIRAMHGHGYDATFSGGAYFFNTTGDRTGMRIDEAYSRLHGLRIGASMSEASPVYAVTVVGNTTGRRVTGVVVETSDNTGAGKANGIGAYSLVAQSPVIATCLVKSAKTNGFFTNSGTALLYGCTSATDIEISSAILKNMIIGGVLVGTANAASTNNIVSSGTAPGSNPETGTPTFIDAAGGDYHLAESDTLALGQGADLSADASFPLSYDIDDQAITQWSIGADAQAGPFDDGGVGPFGYSPSFLRKLLQKQQVRKLQHQGVRYAE